MTNVLTDRTKSLETISEDVLKEVRELRKELNDFRKEQNNANLEFKEELQKLNSKTPRSPEARQIGRKVNVRLD